MQQEGRTAMGEEAVVANGGILILKTAKLCRERRELIHLEQKGRQSLYLP